MNHEPVSFIAGNAFPELLQCPIGRRVARDIEMNEPSRMDFHDEEDIDRLECRPHHNEEITRNDGSCVIAHEGHPPLLRVCRTPGPLRHVTPNSAWRNPDANLEQ